MEDLEVQKRFDRKRAQSVVDHLKKRNFGAEYQETAEDAKNAALGLIPKGSSVIFTGSQTLEQIGVKPHIRESGEYNLIDPYQPGLTKEEGVALRKKGLTADVMVSSSNAITEEGVLVNLDGMGNRVAGMVFGPTKVVLAVGVNKVVTDEQEAVDRIKTRSAPMNSMRLELKNPCVETGFCHDCSNSTRICNYYSIIERSMIPERIHVILIGGEYGY